MDRQDTSDYAGQCMTEQDILFVLALVSVVLFFSFSLPLRLFVLIDRRHLTDPPAIRPCSHDRGA